MRVVLSRPVLAIVASLSYLALGLESAAAASKGTFGTLSDALSVSAAPTTDLGAVNPALSFTNASFASGATGLRNRLEGGIEVSGLTGSARFGLLYWAVITLGEPTADHAKVFLRKGLGPFSEITGIRIGTGDSPCWDGDRINVYRALVPSSLASGNGFYTIRLRPGASGSITGGNPWTGPQVLPFFEGASLVIVGTGTAAVSVYDIGFAGRTFTGALSYQLNTVSVASASEVLFLNIGADGQKGGGFTSSPSSSGEVTTLNGLKIAGADSPATDSDWDGSVAGPLPQLWDNATHNVTSEARAGATPTSLPVSIEGESDCLVTVASVVSVK